MSLPANFWAKVAPSDCTIWTGAVNGKGYPCFAVGGVSQLAHRLAWQDAHGPIPEGMTVDHTCRVRNCVRVDHLELVSSAENNRRALEASGYVIGGECGRGHALAESNVKRVKRGQLVCLTCARQDARNAAARAELAEGKVPSQVIRDWARENDIPVSARGRLGTKLRRRYAEAHQLDGAA